MIQLSETKSMPLDLATTWTVPVNLSLPSSIDTMMHSEETELPPELANAAIDDEPETSEEVAAVAEARANQQSLLNTNELRRRLGL